MYTSDVLLGVVPRDDAVGHRNGDLDTRDERSDEDPGERVDLKEHAMARMGTITDLYPTARSKITRSLRRLCCTTAPLPVLVRRRCS
jgi:hypothetical protein